MPLETPSHDADQEREHSNLYKLAVGRFHNGYKLDHDTMNVWGALGHITPEVPQLIDNMKPRKHYREYVEEIDQRWRAKGTYAEMIMQRSDPEYVAAFDRLVDEFNADLERIKREKDFIAVKLFIIRAKEIIYAK